MVTVDVAARIRRHSIPLLGASDDYDPLLKMIGDARIVCLGEASHGTHEFYNERARITRRLIEERGFNAIGIEGDWPDAYRIGRYVLEQSDDPNANLALEGFERFPTWMWRNEVVLEFVEWLRLHNSSYEPNGRTHFYGLDLYSLYRSIDAVVGYLSRVDPQAARRAREAYSCFDFSHRNEQLYGARTAYGETETCEQEAVRVLLDVMRTSAGSLPRDGDAAGDDAFYAEQNARVIVDAERYYRQMYRAGEITWNLCDSHMADTVEAIIRHFDANGRQAKVVVWAHNSHVGDARATEMGARGELNIGQLMRERHGGAVRLIGFSTHHGAVTAASDWGGIAERKRVRAGLPGSFEDLFHQAGGDFMLPLRGDGSGAAADAIRETRLQRAIGVIYRPETERYSHYFHTNLPLQFDAVLHFDQTEALRPLELDSAWEEGEVAETYPFGV